MHRSFAWLRDDALWARKSRKSRDSLGTLCGVRENMQMRSSIDCYATVKTVPGVHPHCVLWSEECTKTRRKNN